MPRRSTKASASASPDIPEKPAKRSVRKSTEPPTDDAATAVAKPRKRKGTVTAAAAPELSAIASSLTGENVVAETRRVRGKIPHALQFPLVATLGLALSGLGYSLLGEVTKGELAAVSRSQDSWAETGVLAGWRLAELAIGWFGNLDSLDVATMEILSHGPALYLLTAFYNLSPLTALSALAVNALSAALPFYLLRPLADLHARRSAVPNGELVDLSLQAYTAALSSGIYTVIVVLSLRFLLPSILVVHFNGLPSLEPAYNASYATVLPATLLLGIAASTFIFAPFVVTGQATEDVSVALFDPAAATLKETLWWNTWGYTAKTKVVIWRTAAAVLVTAVSTYLACTISIYGVQPAGAAAYASVWALAAACTGVGLGFVGGD